MFKLVFTENPSVIEWQVQQAIEEGFDLDGSPFVLAGNFCQPMRSGVPIFEYKLISAFHPSKFEQVVQQMELDKWRLDGRNAVDWNGSIFQWMLRLKGQAVKVENASAYAGAVVTTIPGYKLVAGVHVLGSLVPSLGVLSGVVR